MNELDINQALKIIETAFIPLTCCVEPYDFDRKLRFKIYDEQKKAVLECQELMSDLATSPSRLSWAIENIRKEILDQKTHLESWTFPLDKK